MRNEVLLTSSEEETEELGERLSRRLVGGELVTLHGGLGAGKTVVVRGMARGLGVPCGVCSPTYTLVNEYPGGRLPLYHVDLYRLGGAAEVEGLGLDECLESGVVAVEWPEVGAPFWGGYRPRLEVRIEVVDETKRRITVEERR